MLSGTGATALVTGSTLYPNIRGTVNFVQTAKGVLVTAEIRGLPVRNSSQNPFFAFHIHSGESCTGNSTDPFADADGHYNPFGVPHPAHAGDLPPLLSAGGIAYSSVLTNRFRLGEIIGKTVIIHAMDDDFMIQPAGNSGAKIACGVIKRIR